MSGAPGIFLLRVCLLSEMGASVSIEKVKRGHKERTSSLLGKWGRAWGQGVALEGEGHCG